MESNISIFFIIEIIGTVAFASSGALVAIKQRLDLLGVVVLGVTTAVGGGMLRDIILGIVPPSPVSYTHLDVYKRQSLHCSTSSRSLSVAR